MKFVEYQKSTFKHFAQKLYISAFIPDERREFSQILHLLNTDNFKFYIVEDSLKPLAILLLWHLDAFYYIEHLAVEQNIRNNKIGTNIIQYLQNKIFEPIVLEVELPLSIEAQRRISFYQRLGFTILNNYYLQPPYSTNKNEVEMKIMLYENDTHYSLSFEKIKETIYTMVYNKSYKYNSIG
ncbi:MAG: GNAT family N-acetyltransferase [Bacteroidales bacterium]|jgi:ribosomal protein S18 acetylase RimI-like enzyme|nr:GNAT family N-acetyltransferase [Bacteroidales bacterium]